MKYRELRRLLARHGVEEIRRKGKGAHREFRRGQEGYVIPYHGDNQDVLRCYLKDLQRIFGVDLGA